MEDDLQHIAENYDSTGKKLLVTDDKVPIEYLNAFTSNSLAKKPEFGIANEDVPEHLKEWICTPQKFKAYMQK